MSYSILRVAKVKNSTDSKGIQKHNQRENEKYANKDIDHEKTFLNYDLINQENIQYKDKINQIIDDGYSGQRKIRSDAIKHVDGIITSDEAFFDEQHERKYFEDSLEFLKKEYGGGNLIYATVHLDEKTPHMHFGFVPLTEDGRLSAKEVLGNKKALSELQDRFHDFVNEKGHKLERGEKGSSAEHLEMQDLKARTLQGKIKGLENEFVEKQEELEEIKIKLTDLDKAWDSSKLIDQYEVKESKLGSKMVKMAHSDFDSMKSLAKSSEVLKIENTALKTENMNVHQKNAELKKQNYNFSSKNDKLNKDIKTLKEENDFLQHENKFLHRTVEQFKVRFKDHVQELSRKIGVIKANVLDKMELPFYKRFFQDQGEVQGASQFIKAKEQEKEKTNAKQKVREDYEHER